MVSIATAAVICVFGLSNIVTGLYVWEGTCPTITLPKGQFIEPAGSRYILYRTPKEDPTKCDQVFFSSDGDGGNNADVVGISLRSNKTVRTEYVFTKSNTSKYSYYVFLRDYPSVIYDVFFIRGTQHTSNLIFYRQANATHCEFDVFISAKTRCIRRKEYEIYINEFLESGFPKKVVDSLVAFNHEDCDLEI